MKHVKVLILAAVAAMAMMAFGASSASASELCSTNTAPCTGTMYPSGTEIHAVLKSGTTATLTSSLVNVHCTGSTVNGKTTNTGTTGSPVLGKITALSFTGCKTTGGTNCEVTVVGVNATTQPNATVTATGGGNGVMGVAPEAGKTAPGAKVVCGFFINCTFEAPEGFELDVDGGNPALVTAIEEPLDRTGGFCPEESFWDATYEVTSPKPLYIVHP